MVKSVIMDATTSALIREISTNLEPLRNLNNPFYLDPNFLGAILTSIVAVSLGYMSIRMQRKNSKHIEKQLRIEQEPYVVADGSIVLVGNGLNKVTLKNVGRGSALRVTCSIDKRNRDKAFFEDTEPHSYYLSTNESVTSAINGNIILKIKQKLHFYIIYESRLGEIYTTDVKMKLLAEKMVIMENQKL